jgi:NADP-dependent aldehyde dehydrogenase
VDAIAEAAAAARADWEAMGPAGRAAALRAVAAALDAQAGELAAVADTETALGSTRLTGEVARTTGQLRMFADVLEDGGYLDLITSPPARACPSCRMVGRSAVAVFSTSNFPSRSRGGGGFASALAAGCPW